MIRWYDQLEETHGTISGGHTLVVRTMKEGRREVKRNKERNKDEREKKRRTMPVHPSFSGRIRKWHQCLLVSRE